MRRVVVTGADGFLGRHLVSALERRGVVVTALTRHATSKAGAFAIAMGDAPWNPSKLREVIEAAMPDVIFHLVGGAAGSHAELEMANRGATTPILQAVRDLEVRPLLVCCGSAAEYGAAIVDARPVCETAVCAPVTVYGMCKLAQTNAVLDFASLTGTPVLIARLFNPIGAGMPPYLALGDFARQIAMLPNRGTLETGNIHVYRDFIDVGDVVEALCTLSQNPAARGIVNICSGEVTRLSWLVDLLIRQSGKAISVQTVPARMRPGEPAVVVGSTALLACLGAKMPRTDYPEVMAQIWDEARTRWSGL